jgi:hypothetical protein
VRDGKGDGELLLDQQDRHAARGDLLEECADALDHLSELMSGVDAADLRGALPRSVTCHVTDLDVVFAGTLDVDGFRDVERYDAGGAPPAQIRLAMSSDDLVALSAGELDFAGAWLRGRISVGASFGDLLKLRRIF